MSMTKHFMATDINSELSNTISNYIADGYKIDAKESAIDTEKDKDCTFKAVLKRDVDGILCKTIITLSEYEDSNNKSSKYHKVDFVGDTKWSEESHHFSSSTSMCEKENKEDDKSKSDNADATNNKCKSKNLDELENYFTSRLVRLLSTPPYYSGF